MQPQEFYTYADLCERYNKSKVTLWRWVRAGRLPAPVQLGPNSVAFRGQEIRETEDSLERVAYSGQTDA